MSMSLIILVSKVKIKEYAILIYATWEQEKNLILNAFS